MQKVKHFFELLLAFTIKEIKARYKSAVLGFLWLFLNPIIQMVVMGFVFSLLFRFGIKDYYLFLFTGLLPWNFFSLSLTKATPAVVYERNLIQKSSFPREVIPLSIVISNFFHLLISLLLFGIYLFIAGKLEMFSLINLGYFSLGLVLLLIFTASFSLITASLNVFWRDVNFFTQALILIWFYVTPILYPLSLIPQRFRPIFYLNPLSGIFSSFQAIIVGSEKIPPSVLWAQAGAILLISLSGVLLFKNRSKYFSDWL